MDKTLFFGYGAYRDKERIEVILRISGFTGDDLTIEGGFGARIDGYILAIQNLQQIPEASRESLSKAWEEILGVTQLKQALDRWPGFYGRLAKNNSKL